MKKIEATIHSMTISLSDSYCDKHTFWKDGKEQIKKVQLIHYKDECICPLCESMERTKELEEKMRGVHKDKLDNPNRLVFLKDSLIVDDTITNARFTNYKAENDEEKENLDLVKNCLDMFLEGKRFTLWLQGNPGAGKSHLAYSFAYSANQQGNYKVLFVDMSELIRTIRATFANNKLHDSEQSIVRRLVEADLLILDDVGAESGAIDTNRQASDFVSRVIFAIFNGRQGKTTLATTNLTGAQIKGIYDAKTFSRMFRDYRLVQFKITKDKRFKELPF